MDDVVAAELGPGTIASRLGHQAVERHIWSTAQLVEIAAGRNDELRHAVIVFAGEDVERVRMDVVEHVVAHDQRVTEGTKIGLEISDRSSCLRVGQVKDQVTVEAGHERRRIERYARGQTVYT